FLDLVYVRADAVPGGNGSSWESAFSSIGKALLISSRDGEVWVAGGIYHERVLIVESVDIYAGFSGNEKTRRQLDWVMNQTIIDAGGSGSAVTVANEAILDGFTVTGGHDEGGVYCSAYSPTLINCTITGNSGSGVYCENSSPMLTNCTITGNSGSGVYCVNSSPMLTNCTITRNTARWFDGCGVYCVNSSPTLTNCTITGNTAGRGARGVYCGESSPTLTNCILWNPGVEITQDRLSSAVIEHSCIEHGYEGIGNIDMNPLFVDPANDDFHLQEGSPCIDAGNPDPSYNDACLPPGLGTERCDMGAYGGPGNCGWAEPQEPTAVREWALY
ncbi:MAG: right-handed parallel beta-helix repeat-containing protein, partial [bacterium]